MKQKKEYYPKLKRLIEELGEWNINLHELNREWHIPVPTLCRWKRQIVDDIGILDLKKAGRNIGQAMISNIKLTQRLIRTSTDTKEKLLGVKVYNDIIKGFTEFLESYGYKKRIEAEGSESENWFSDLVISSYKKRKEIEIEQAKQIEHIGVKENVDKPEQIQQAD